MPPPGFDSAFTGSIPKLYEQLMVPMFFAPYAADMAARAAKRQPLRVLEIAAGTGALTRQLARLLPTAASITATDLNPPMLEQARAVGTARPVTWQQADAMQLPFEGEAFDLVVCQFGAMFFPDKAKAFAEARRVLGHGGLFLFSVWDRLDQNEFTATVNATTTTCFPDDPPSFMGRVPHGYYDADVIRQRLTEGGFDRSPTMETVTLRSQAESARVPALALCQGTPVRAEIESRNASRLGEVTDLAEKALVDRFGAGPIEAKLQALVVAVER